MHQIEFQTSDDRKSRHRTGKCAPKCGRVHICRCDGCLSGNRKPRNFRQADFALHHARARLSSGSGCEDLQQRPLQSQYSPAAANQSRVEQDTATRYPSLSYPYDQQEFIPIKCNIHAWMQAYFVVLKTSHFAVTGEDGRFALPDLPPGKYTITAWHEIYGTRSQEITIADGQQLTVDFVFKPKP